MDVVVCKFGHLYVCVVNVLHKRSKRSYQIILYIQTLTSCTSAHTLFFQHGVC